jgi:hypothetical protein
MMASLVRKMAWGLLGAATTKATRRAAGRALHNDRGQPRLPHAARRGRGLRTALVLAAGTGLVLAVSDLLKEQRGEVTDRP